MEFIGYFISLLALFYLFFKQQSYAKHRQKSLEKVAAEKKEHPVMRHPPKPPHVMKQKRKEEGSIEQRQLKSTLESRQIQSSIRKHEEESYHFDKTVIAPSRARVALDRLTSPREMVIYHEIIDKPKSLRQ